jgi:hypothetical protein
MKPLLFTLLLALASNAGAAWNQKRATGSGAAASPPPTHEVVVYTPQAPRPGCVRILSPEHKHAWSCPASQKESE